ncbi:hypothetical protein ACJZ2D_011728 [Fusarium nematophilum]
MTSEAPPRYVYKIIPSAPEEPFPEEHPLSELDQKDGFVHLSTATQVAGTADLFFNKQSSLWIIKLAFDQFAGSIKWEDGFPHLYSNFGAKNVESVEKFAKVGNQTWGEVLRLSTWLE